MLKIATWNVNSLKIRLPQVLDWLLKEQPDLLALQETKLQDPDFPLEAITNAGYSVTYSGQKAYNGVAILSRHPVSEVLTDIPGFDDPARRILGVTYQGIRVLNLYVPNGESVGSDKYRYKLKWLQHIQEHIALLKQKYPETIILGDFNIAPEALDVHEPMLWEGRVLCSEMERSSLQAILQLGFMDCFRKHSSEKVFSWWDYRMNAFKRNMGLRIDHIFASMGMHDKCVRCYIDKAPRAHERPSDHALVVAEFNV